MFAGDFTTAFLAAYLSLCYRRLIRWFCASVINIVAHNPPVMTDGFSDVFGVGITKTRRDDTGEISANKITVGQSAGTTPVINLYWANPSAAFSFPLFDFATSTLFNFAPWTLFLLRHCSTSLLRSQPATTPPQPATAPPQPTTEGRILIEPDGDTFNSSKQPTYKIRYIIRSKYDTPYISWKKVSKEVRDMWFREFEKEVLDREPTPVELHSRTHKQQEEQQWVDERARKAYEEYTRLRESQAAAGECPSGGSAEYFDYRNWLQAVGRMQHNRVYGLGSQAYAYEGQTFSGSSFSSSTQESLYTQ
ncbi:uncharacterized protein LOC110096305 [Dendrobium catenatum]|uniref:uncharacterized protein LOC110096305 n=1 Tax=Dendrobium catenatum TaxID=906689 RepID=UPI0009F62903|nr:uncharacterized protein LOC110096305 [Dendrobium catenatum]